MKQRNLPIGIQEFDAIRQKDYYYVDKTHLIGKLIQKGQFYFLSRPRRFGKSLLVSTIEHLFLGHQSLFEGLDIYDKWDWTQKHPVVRLSFDGGELSTPAEIEKHAFAQLLWIQEEHELTLPKELAHDADVRLDYIIKLLHKKHKKSVVVLIDEYDRSVLNMLTEPKLAEANKKYLRGLYGVIKGCDEYIGFTLITGISMFSKMNLFSAINNLLDISLDPQYASICGYTERDLTTVFAPETKNFDLSEIRNWYDGYNWGNVDGNQIYNPHSVLHLFHFKSFENWWFQGCIPQHVYELMKQNKIRPAPLSGRWIESHKISSFEVEDINIETLLFQSGYLTIKQVKRVHDQTMYQLDYPNFEVRKYLIAGLFKYLGGNVGVNTVSLAQEMTACLVNHDFKRFKTHLHAMLASAPHPWYRKAQLYEYEAWYVSVIYWGFLALGITVGVEVLSSLGQCDLVVRHQDQLFIMEFKATTSKDHNKVAEEAMAQIKDRGYADQHKAHGNQGHLMALVFSKEKRNIAKVLVKKAW